MMIFATGLLSELLGEKNKDIYCFGAGKQFDFFIDIFAECKIDENIKAVVDNNFDVVRNAIKVVNGISIPIITLKKMLKEIKYNEKILITTVAYEEIIEQLEKIEKLNCIEYYIYPIMEIEQYDYNRLNIKVPTRLSVSDCFQIPKTIHYCWFGKKEIPNQYRKWMESWKRYCPDYEIVEWNENNYDINKSIYIRQAYEKKQWAFVSDYARIDIINQYGGVYLDVDVELVKNIDEMLMNSAFCGFETREYINYGLGFGAKKDNSILGEIKEYYDNMRFINDDGTMNRVNCPLIQTEIMKKHGLESNGEFQIVDGMVVYPSRILCGMSPYSFRIERNPMYTYAIHHFAGSWMDDKREKNKLISSIKKWSRNDNYIYPDL